MLALRVGEPTHVIFCKEEVDGAPSLGAFAISFYGLELIVAAKQIALIKIIPDAAPKHSRLIRIGKNAMDMADATRRKTVGDFMRGKVGSDLPKFDLSSLWIHEVLTEVDPAIRVFAEGTVKGAIARDRKQ